MQQNKMSDVVSQECFYVATFISGLEWDGRSGIKKTGIFCLI